jgi:molybdopterin converting factor small subunit
MAIVVFSSAQRAAVGGDERVEIEAARVADLIEALYARYPDLAGQLEGAAVAIDGDIHHDAYYLPLRPESEVHFMGAVAGGSGAEGGVGKGGAAGAVGTDGADGVGGTEPRDPLLVASEWLEAGRRVAIATVLETWGSSPCPAGSQLVVAEDGAFEGSVSAGCVEGAVIEKALEVIAQGAPAALEFGVADEQAWAVGLACGGRILIRVEPIE